MMASHRVPFVDTALAPEAPGISSRAIDLKRRPLGDRRVPARCAARGVVQRGSFRIRARGGIEYEFQRADRGSLVLEQGDGFTLDEGSAHRGRAGSTGARLFLIDRAG